MKTGPWLLCVVLAILIFYLGFINHIEPNEVGLARNRISGVVKLQDTAGWKLTWPWVSVANISTSPLRVGVMSAGRGFSVKLVRFEPKFYKKFIVTEGFRYYWWANRFSFNSGHIEEHRGMKDILRGYAYSDKYYPFIVIVEEYQKR